MRLICLLTAFCARLLAQDSPGPIPPIEDTPGLPRVLLIGDSISIGYTPPVRQLLAGEANVHRISGNAGPSSNGVFLIESWLGKTKWDVIHFNFGLHDVRHFDDAGKATDADKGHRQVSEADYEKNLDQLVARMKKTGAKLVFATTTPVPAGSAGRVVGDEVRYNEIARRVMQKHNVAINNLLPGPFLTTRQADGLRKLAAKAGQDYETFLASRVAENPAGRFGTPDEFGKACAFLCSADAGFIIGQNLVIDGGAVNATI